MEKDLQKKKTEEKDRSLQTILFSSLAIAVLLIVELYLMIAMPGLLPVIVVVGVAFVVCVYVALSACMKRMAKKEKQLDDQYAGILKSEKAAYLLIRKYFDEIEEQMSLLEDKLVGPYQEVIAAQKATAKVTINRNKENADALLNSNDHLAEQVNAVEERLESLYAFVSSNLAARDDDSMDEILKKQAELSSQMEKQIREIELSLKNEILQGVNQLSSVSPQVVMAAPQVMPMSQPLSNVSMESMELGSLDSSEELGGLDALNTLDDMNLSQDLESLGDLPDFTPMDAVNEENLGELDQDEEADRAMSSDEIDALLADMAADTASASLLPDAEEPLEEDELEGGLESLAELELESIAEPMEELPPMPDLSDPNKMMSPDDIAALLANMPSDEPQAEPELEPIAEPVEEIPPMPDLSDPNKMMSPDDIAALLANMPLDEPQAEPELEPIAEPVEEIPPMPDLSDPNKMMSPDDIAALLANMPSDEPQVEPEPEAIAEPVEELPPMPDLSDPNRAMSPDEIAALFANLG